MLTEKEVEALKDAFVEHRKKLSYQMGKAKKPDYHGTYRLSEEMVDQIKTHAVYGSFPEKLITARAPNMTDKEYEYIKDNYKQITLPVFVDYVNTVSRAFSDNNWQIDYVEPDQDDEDSFQYYVERQLQSTPLRMSLESFIRQVVPAIKTIDAMGLIVVKPYQVEIVIDEKTQAPVIRDDAMFEPVPFYYESSQLVAYEEDEYYLFELKEKAVVNYGGKPVRDGIILELYDDSAIYRITQIGNKIDYKFEIIEYYRHDFKKIPVTRLKGIPRPTASTELIWQSPFLYACPVLDEAVIDANMLRSVKANCVYPYRVMTGSICEHKLELDGEIKCCAGTGQFTHYETGKTFLCPNCGGSGLKDRVSPHGVLLLKPESIEGQGDMKASQPAMYYVAPGTETPAFIREEIERFMNKAREILHIKTSATEFKPADDVTATGQMLDERAVYAFIKTISDQIFEIYDFCLDWIHLIRYGTPFEGTLVYPNTFDVKTSGEYMTEIANAIKAGLPPFMVHTIIYRFLRAMFYNQIETAAAFDLIVKTDRLMMLSSDEIGRKVSKGSAAHWEEILHDSAITFIMELQIEDPAFLTLDTKVQQEKLIAKAKETAEGIKQLNSQAGQTLVQSVLSQAGQNRLAATGS